jgi:hypothetical protein
MIYSDRSGQEHGADKSEDQEGEQQLEEGADGIAENAREDSMSPTVRVF